jgi:DNA mismatch endonuclease (patch repair protein)
MGNRRRDQQAIKSLSSQGWRVLVVWECATRGLSEIESRKLLRRISAWLKSGDGFLEIRS